MRTVWTGYAVWVWVWLMSGASFGFVRGLDYLPTLWAAPIEGAVLFAVPAALVGLLGVGGAALLRWLVASAGGKGALRQRLLLLPRRAGQKQQSPEHNP